VDVEEEEKGKVEWSPIPAAVTQEKNLQIVAATIAKEEE